MKKRAVMVRPAMEVGVESAEAGTGQRTGHKEGTVRLEPQRSRLSPKPGWRQRRQLRTTTKYRQIQEGFGTTDAEIAGADLDNYMHSVEVGTRLHF